MIIVRLQVCLVDLKVVRDNGELFRKHAICLAYSSALVFPVTSSDAASGRLSSPSHFCSKENIVGSQSTGSEKIKLAYIAATGE